MIDFLFIYEHKAREMENLCLIKNELDIRGYSSRFLNVWDLALKKQPKIKAKVVVMPAFMEESVIDYYIYSIAGNVKKIINLQWEQLYSEIEDTAVNSIRSIKGIAKQAVHISWGDNNTKYLIKNGVKPKNIALTGPVHMDFLRDCLKKYYLSRDELLSAHNIDCNKKICLFISSFLTADESQHILDYTLDKVENKEKYKKMHLINVQSQKIILDWIQRLLDEDENLVFIYRPHPSERDSSFLNDISNKYNNFKILRDHSVKQWILCCDKIYSWYSTSIVEAFFANKVCGILRPIPIEEGMDMDIYKGADCIENYDAFKDSLGKEDLNFPINPEIIYKNYDVDKEIPSYIRVCDTFEKVISSDEHDIEDDLKELMKSRNYKTKIKRVIRTTFLYTFYNFILGLIGTLNKKFKLPLPSKVFLKALDHDTIIKMREHDYISEGEFNRIIDRINLAVSAKKENMN